MLIVSSVGAEIDSGGCNALASRYVVSKCLSMTVFHSSVPTSWIKSLTMISISARWLSKISVSGGDVVRISRVVGAADVTGEVTLTGALTDGVTNTDINEVFDTKMLDIEDISDEETT